MLCKQDPWNISCEFFNIIVKTNILWETAFMLMLAQIKSNIYENK